MRRMKDENMNSCVLNMSTNAHCTSHTYFNFKNWATFQLIEWVITYQESLIFTTSNFCVVTTINIVGLGTHTNRNM